MLLLAFASAAVADAPFVFGERPGETHVDGPAAWHDALLRASVSGCEKRVPPGENPRPGIRDCVVNQVHVTSDSALVMECHVRVELPFADDSGRTIIEESLEIGPGEQRWVARSYGPANMMPVSWRTTCRPRS